MQRLLAQDRLHEPPWCLLPSLAANPAHKTVEVDWTFATAAFFLQAAAACSLGEVQARRPCGGGLVSLLRDAEAGAPRLQGAG